MSVLPSGRRHLGVEAREAEATGHAGQLPALDDATQPCPGSCGLASTHGLASGVGGHCTPSPGPHRHHLGVGGPRTAGWCRGSCGGVQLWWQFPPGTAASSWKPQGPAPWLLLFNQPWSLFAAVPRRPAGAWPILMVHSLLSLPRLRTCVAPAALGRGRPLWALPFPPVSGLTASPWVSCRPPSLPPIGEPPHSPKRRCRHAHAILAHQRTDFGLRGAPLWSVSFLFLLF